MKKKYAHLFRIILFMLFFFSVNYPPSAYSGNSHIAILLSDDDISYIQPAKTFEAEVNMPSKTYNLKGKVINASPTMEMLYANDPALILALGAKAAYVAKIESQKKEKNIPIIFAMVLNWERYDLLKDAPYIAGISTDLDPGTLFANLILFSSNVTKIGVIYSKQHSSYQIEKAINASKLLQLELLAESIEHHKDFREAFSRIENNIDAFWILNDPVIFTPKNMDWLKSRCIKEKISTIGQSQNLAKIGILLAISVEAQDIGVQSASMARNILYRKQSPQTIGVMPPLCTKLILNANTANKINLPLNNTIKNMANNIVDE